VAGGRRFCHGPKSKVAFNALRPVLPDADIERDIDLRSPLDAGAAAATPS
jgi:hypothetical protein